MTEKSPTVQRAARPGQRTGDTKGRETLSGPQSQFCCGLNPSFWGPPDCLEWDFSRTWKEATVRSHTGSEGRQEMKSLLQKFLSWSAAASPGGGGPRKRRFRLGEGRRPLRRASPTGRGGGCSKDPAISPTAPPAPRWLLPAHPSRAPFPKDPEGEGEGALPDREKAVKSAPKWAGGKHPRAGSPPFWLLILSFRSFSHTPAHQRALHPPTPHAPLSPRSELPWCLRKVQERGPQPSPAGVQGAWGGGTSATPLNHHQPGHSGMSNPNPLGG